MALEVKGAPRVIEIEANVRVPIPDPDMTIDEALIFFSATYPQLTTATVEGPKLENDEYVYTVKTTIGTKG